MTTRVYESRVSTTVQALWDFHASVDALQRLTPPQQHVEILSEDRAVRNGALHILRIRQFGIPMVWRARISEVQSPYQFRDTAESGPFPAWTHLHEFIEAGAESILRDTVTYRAPGGRIADWLFVGRQIDVLFAFRHAQTIAALSQSE